MNGERLPRSAPSPLAFWTRSIDSGHNADMNKDMRKLDNPRILVIEDDASLREVLQMGLRGEGFTVDLAQDGPKGLAAFKEHDPDLVLLDVMLPGMNGFEVLSLIHISE